jgi:hypothetical protein
VVDGPALAGDPDRGARGREAERTRRGTEDLAAGTHEVVLSLSTYRRWNRPPIRVTIS